MGKMIKGGTRAKRRGIKITRLMARDGEYCQLCGDPLDRHIDDDMDPLFITFDHIVPASKGGTDDIRNLQLAHKSCNEARGNMHVFEYKERWQNGIAGALKASARAS